MVTPLYETLANAFIAEGVDTLFVLTGDGNMHWEASLSERPGFRSIHVRHEHCACAMATAYAVASGKIGVASVTCGPGLTQIMTALATAAHARIPLVVFAGESPLHAAWYNQHIDQAPLVRGAGAHYLSAHSPKLMHSYVAEAFLHARTKRGPVVLGVPLDVQQEETHTLPPYVPSRDLVPDCGPLSPDQSRIEAAVGMLARAERPIVIGGRGVIAASAEQESLALAEACGALLSSTLPVRGLFDESPYSIGIAGGFAHSAARDLFKEADLVIAIGASLSNHTVDGGRLFPNAKIIQIDKDPVGVRQGLRAADVYLQGDAKIILQACLELIELQGTRSVSSWRNTSIAEKMAGPADDHWDVEGPSELDPRATVQALDRTIPKDWEIVNSSGHCSYFAAQMRGRSHKHFLAIREFGAIGNGLSYAIGVAIAKPGRPVVLLDGDGGLMMHVQELETVQRYGLPILVCVLNDGAYGSEIHKLRADGLSDRGAVFGRGDLGRLARGFGLDGQVVKSLDQIPQLMDDFGERQLGTLLDFHISDQVLSPVMRRQVASRK